MHCGSSQWVRRSTGSGSVVLLCGQTHTQTHRHSGVICIGSSRVLLLKAAHCVLHPPHTLFMWQCIQGLGSQLGSCDFEYPITNRHETDTMTRTPSHIYMSIYICMQTDALTMGLQRTPWCSGSPWWWEDPRGSVSGGPGAWRTSPSWETPRYSRNAGTCSLHPDTHTHKRKVSS